MPFLSRGWKKFNKVNLIALNAHFGAKPWLEKEIAEATLPESNNISSGIMYLHGWYHLKE